MTDHEVAVWGLGVAVVAGIGTWLGVPQFRPGWWKRKRNDIQFTSPRPLEMMQDTRVLSPGLCYRFTGTLRSLPKDHQIWLLTQNVMTKEVWPQGFAAVLYWPDLGTWEGFVFARSAHLQLTVVAVVAPPSAQMIFSYFQGHGLETNWAPLPRIPDECTNRATIQVIVP